jgi:hypothetical protein
VLADDLSTASGEQIYVEIKIILLYNEEEHIKHSTKYQKLFINNGKHKQYKLISKCFKEVML